MIPNYYAILGVAPGASALEIKRAYRRQARQHHPDLNGQAQDQQIKSLNEAYAVLGDPHKRAAYDERLRQARQWAEAARRQRQREEQARREPKMTWMEGMIGFVRELKKGMRDD